MVLAPAPLNLRLLAQRGREAHLQGVVSSYSAEGCIGAEEADRWFSEYLDFPCRLVHKPDDDPRLVDSSIAESGDQSTREQAPAVTSLCVRSRRTECPSLGSSSDATSSTTHSGPSVSVTSSRPSSAERRRRPYLVAAFRTPSNAEPERTSTRRPGSTLPPLITATVRREVGSSSL